MKDNRDTYMVLGERINAEILSMYSFFDSTLFYILSIKTALKYRSKNALDEISRVLTLVKARIYVHE